MKKEIKAKINVKFTNGADSAKIQRVIKLLAEAYLARISYPLNKPASSSAGEIMLK